jgi:hypothetical protein
MVTMILQRDTSLDMWVHHVCAFTGASLSLIYQQGNFIPTAFSITELTVVPHNLLWYVKTLAPQHRKAVRVLEWLRLLSFIVFRLPIGPYSAYRVHQLGQVQRFLSSEMHILVRVLTVAFLGLFSSLNVVWTLWMFQGLLKKLKRKP